MRLALYQPDIPQNTGTIMRMTACFGMALDIIGPAGFQLSDRALRRAGLDYLDQGDFTLHVSWDSFMASRVPGRLVLFTARGEAAFHDFRFALDDTLLFGRESAGAPETVHKTAHARLRIPIRPGLRSLNLAVAAAMVTGEALRQTEGFPAS